MDPDSAIEPRDGRWFSQNSAREAALRFKQLATAARNSYTVACRRAMHGGPGNGKKSTMVEVFDGACVGRADRVVHRLGYFQGFASDAPRDLKELLKQSISAPPPRGEMEEIVRAVDPYCVFATSMPPAGHRIRVHAWQGARRETFSRRHSVGIGGHISSDDIHAGDDVYQEGMRRESRPKRCSSTPVHRTLCRPDQRRRYTVGQVHLGVVHYQRRFSGRASTWIRADQCGFQPVEELLADLSGFETWSRFACSVFREEARDAYARVQSSRGRVATDGPPGSFSIVTKTTGIAGQPDERSRVLLRR